MTPVGSVGATTRMPAHAPVSMFFLLTLPRGHRNVETKAPTISASLQIHSYRFRIIGFVASKPMRFSR
jgi:hypothetical protein